MSGTTMGYRLEAGILVLLHGERSPSDIEWTRFLNEQRARGANAVRIAIVYSHGGGPNGHQRAMLKQFQKGEARSEVTTALLTNSALARGLGVAMSWFLRNVRVFPLDGEADAFKFAGLTAQQGTRVRELRAEIERELGIKAPGAHA